jgi:Rad3-related DNA helicase
MRDDAQALETVTVAQMTHHFEERLRERLGIELTIERLNQLLAESKRIGRQCVYYKLINCVFCRRVLLGQWWHHEAGVIMLIDEWKSKAVTIITPKDKLSIRARRPHDERRG